MTQTHQARPRLLATAVLTALMLPGAAFAQTAKERELEARVAQLEQMVQQLVAQQQQTETAVTEVRTAQAAQPAPAPAAATGTGAAAPIQTTTIVPTSGSTFTVGGMIRTDGLVTKTTDGAIGKGTAGRDFYVPGAIPVGGNGPDTYSDAHLKFSRLWFDASTVLGTGDRLGARVELDFFGGALGNSAATNTYGATLRHAYLTYNNWLVGQTWSNFMDTAALIDAVDFVGPTDAVVFVRQPQLRYTSGPWAVSIESPETTVQPFGGGARVIAGNNSAIPDVVARYTHKGDWGHVSVAGMARQLKYEPVAGSNSTDTGFGATVSGLVKLGDSTDIRYQVSGGEGIGRYIGLATVQQDAMVDSAGNLDALGGWAGYVGLRQVFSPQVRGNLYYARSQWDNDTTWTGFGVTRKVHSLHANMIWSPVPRLDFGVEAIWGERTLESGVDGELIRLHTMARYTF
ncbi:DcaP family trimeric outer membrane transporter [Luteimonas sp BLCC-B24]|uniref:DcaP family trimeric outer membrane transporter n=1 Tax=Luteimonas sp. BLCC-B24 TaxID=3025317 RepID=UPI00234DB679|nr:DcaP family trimeric outer membrane transporter [Luteimonas sp. BLCC-B24]MDC7808274.1 DcaP family trimeric outer membrane transporter [Luteimonas sp. BLCC-B24]